MHKGAVFIKVGQQIPYGDDHAIIATPRNFRKKVTSCLQGL